MESVVGVWRVVGELFFLRVVVFFAFSAFGLHKTDFGLQKKTLKLRLWTRCRRKVWIFAFSLDRMRPILDSAAAT